MTIKSGSTSRGPSHDSARRRPCDGSIRVAAAVVLAALTCGSWAASALAQAAPNLLVNGDFFSDAAFWQAEGGAVLARDVAGDSPSSGAALVTNSATTAQQGLGIGQCVGGIDASGSYDFGGRVLLPAGQTRTGDAQVGLRWYSDSACQGSSLGSQPRLSTSTIGSYTALGATGQRPPAGAKSVLFLAFPSKVEAGGTLSALYDDLYLRPATPATLQTSGQAYRVRIYPNASVSEGLLGDREPGTSGAFWFAIGLYDNPTGFYTPVVRRLTPDGTLTDWTLDSPQSFFARGVKRDPASGAVWVLVALLEPNRSFLYRLNPSNNAVLRFDVPVEGDSLQLEPGTRTPWVFGRGRFARVAENSVQVYSLDNFEGGASPFDAQGRTFLQSDDNATYLSFTAATERLTTYRDAGESLVFPTLDENGTVWALPVAQGQHLIRFDPTTRVRTRHPLVNAAPNWAGLLVSGGRAGLAAAYGPHFATSDITRLGDGVSTTLATPSTVSLPHVGQLPVTTSRTAAREERAIAFEERVLYARNDEGRALFTSSGYGYNSILWSSGGEFATGSAVQWWRPLPTNESFRTKAALPVAVEVRPTDPTRNFFTEVALANLDGGATVTLAFRTTAGEYTSTLFLAPGTTRVFPNIVQTLRELGAAIPAGDVAGTLTAHFGNGTGLLSARIYTRASDGSTTGTGYTSLDPNAELLAYRKSLNGLKNTPAYRTNVAVANLCGGEKTCTTLDIAASFFDDSTGLLVGGASVPISVPPGEWRQLNAPLDALGATGQTFSVIFVPFSEGTLAYDAYATVVNNTNQDSAFVRAIAIGNSSRLTLPFVTDAQGVGTRFTSECAITNTTGRDTVADVTFTSANTGRSVTEVLALANARGVFYENAVAHFRALDPGVLGDDFGPLRIVFRQDATGFVSSRTTAANGTGLGVVAIDPFIARALRRKTIVGLKQTTAFRTNLTVVHTGATTNTPAPISVLITIRDASGNLVGTLTRTLEPGRSFQWNQVLSREFGVQGEGYTATVERTDGQDAFDAYISINDNISNDPTFLRAE